MCANVHQLHFAVKHMNAFVQSFLMTHFIKQWRKKRHLTQGQVAKRIGMSRPNYCRIENGKVPYNEYALEALAEALRCSPADLISSPPK